MSQSEENLALTLVSLAAVLRAPVPESTGESEVVSSHFLHSVAEAMDKAAEMLSNPKEQAAPSTQEVVDVLTTCREACRTNLAYALYKDELVLMEAFKAADATIKRFARSTRKRRKT